MAAGFLAADLFGDGTEDDWHGQAALTVGYYGGLLVTLALAYFLHDIAQRSAKRREARLSLAAFSGAADPDAWTRSKGPDDVRPRRPDDDWWRAGRPFQ